MQATRKVATLSTNDVLLVEDDVNVSSTFTAAFGDRFDWCRSVPELTTRFPNGAPWEWAFIDLRYTQANVAPSTGLGAFLHLRQYAPETQIVVLTQPTERGRRLFSIAAFHWFDVRLIEDKTCLGAPELRQICNGEFTMPRAALKRYSDNAYLIDALFQREWWSKAWAVWPDSLGRLSDAASLMRTEARALNTLDTFRKRAQVAVEDLLHIFYQADPLRYSEDPKGAKYLTMYNFAYQNNLFFSAPELEAALAYSKPWTRSKLGI